MKKLFVVLFFFTAGFTYAQRVTLTRIHYTAIFDEKLGYPVLVTWTLKSSDICPKTSPKYVKRLPTFSPDPTIPTFTNFKQYYQGNTGGWQQGHNCDADDNSCNPQEMKESFYYSNVTPQNGKLNEHRWEQLEKHTRDLAATTTVQIWCGSYGNQGTLGTITIPKYCWKILKYNNTEEVYIMPNDDSVMLHPYTYYSQNVSVATIRQATGLPLPGL